MNRRLSRGTAIATMLCVLFMQLALSAFACPGATSDCDQMRTAPSPLCHSHCGELAQSLDKAELPGIAPPVVVAVMQWPALGDPVSPSQVAATAHRALPPEPPPPPRNCCLRL